MDELDEVRLIVDELHAGLETLPYYVFLGIAETETHEQLRAAFHRRAQKFHPDRFHLLTDQELRARIYAVYKRITEAYRVLGDPEQRRRYEEQRRQGAVRLQHERPTPGRAPEDTIADLRARRFFRAALDAEQRGDAKGLKLNLLLAQQLAPGNEAIQQKLAQLKP